MKLPVYIIIIKHLKAGFMGTMARSTTGQEVLMAKEQHCLSTFGTSKITTYPLPQNGAYWQKPQLSTP